MVDETDIVPFGFLPFDYHVMATWDPNSPFSKKQQHRVLVESWLRLGKHGRNKYPAGDDPPDEFPLHVPQDLMTEEERALDGQISRVFWIRTWYGQKDDKASQDAADVAYSRLRIMVMQDGDPNVTNSCLEEECIFESKEEFGPDIITTPEGDTNPDFEDGIARGTPGSVPSYLITALMHYPDTFEGLSRREWHWPHISDETLPDLEKWQDLMIVVADRKACEEGWVLFLAVNHHGKILPFRARERASWTEQMIANYLDGQKLDENTSDSDKEMEFYLRGGSGWDPDSVP
ncbi:hypothetical protein N7517_003116 [Penicillium concentricum]|uniref:Uncharacterized protein n=1 Tax=Penicillium concentricum TaxID=293559 RepID=A0A9W9SV82_9EURO|nr:uncharacterized protein N7517_003116 [Penicillium concentricum]KAJ5385205.1 hypothetical protein N7517_003116 [Penicillium concentricum]